MVQIAFLSIQPPPYYLNHILSTSLNVFGLVAPNRITSGDSGVFHGGVHVFKVDLRDD